ncbi:DUF2398 family protein [Glycomyces buryatensis]|uniref:DUF2398 family protein n=1 Tax=Glycomyces buryatensis TaxID=2570927 RepID=A0A4S8QE42_9ACTN|nr:DUF2398 family protein [Glycomyces buryatensis]THV41175.1 DUF2398 family protein [Glycomyces buryatensis]
MSRFATAVSDGRLDEYQRALRLLLKHGYITENHPDSKALPQVRKYAVTLRADLAEAFGYRLELRGAIARLIRAKDTLDDARSAFVKPEGGGPARIFDRRRYAYLALTLAVLGRAGLQTMVSELARSVGADASRIDGLGFDQQDINHKRAFYDAVTWLEERGVVTVADGSTSSWAANPDTGEALYDVDRDALFALWRPGRTLQSITGVKDLHVRPEARSDNERRREAGRAARRAVVENPVVYFHDCADSVANHLRSPVFAADIERLTGLRLERRAEGVTLIDTVRFSVEQFPGTGAVAQAAILLSVEACDAAADPDHPVRTVAYPAASASERLASRIDSALPAGSRVDLPDTLTVDDADAVESSRGPAADAPFVTDAFLQQSTVMILARYGKAFGADWHANPARLCWEAVDLLTRFGLARRVDGGVLVEPAAGRYRNTVAEFKPRHETLF